MNRRDFLQTSALAASASYVAPEARAANAAANLVVDSHMHVWADDRVKYPFPHPYVPTFNEPPCRGTVEMLVDDMNRFGCTHAVLVQVIYHGWDNSYIADCVEQLPDRFKAQGLIDPTTPDTADKLRYWVKDRGLSGMRFSPIYYQNGNHGGDAWLSAPETHPVWETAEELGAVFNFFIAASQLDQLETMVRAHPTVRVVIDHLSQIDLGAENAEADFRRLLEMAQYPNLWVKISELTSVSASKQYPFADAYPYIRRAYNAFGADRLLFGTGYPGGARAHYERPSLGQEIDLIRTQMPLFTPEERQKILGANAAVLWDFSQANR